MADRQVTDLASMLMGRPAPAPTGIPGVVPAVSAPPSMTPAPAAAEGKPAEPPPQIIKPPVEEPKPAVPKAPEPVPEAKPVAQPSEIAAFASAITGAVKELIDATRELKEIAKSRTTVQLSTPPQDTPPAPAKPVVVESSNPGPVGQDTGHVFDDPETGAKIRVIAKVGEKHEDAIKRVRAHHKL